MQTRTLMISFITSIQSISKIGIAYKEQVLGYWIGSQEPLATQVPPARHILRSVAQRFVQSFAVRAPACALMPHCWGKNVEPQARPRYAAIQDAVIINRCMRSISYRLRAWCAGRLVLRGL